MRRMLLRGTERTATLLDPECYVLLWKEGGLDNVYVRKNDGINSPDVAVASLDRWETHPTRQAHVRRIDTIILPFFKDPLFRNSS
jgi:hypothetical protein